MLIMTQCLHYVQELSLIFKRHVLSAKDWYANGGVGLVVWKEPVSIKVPSRSQMTHRVTPMIPRAGSLSKSKTCRTQQNLLPIARVLKPRCHFVIASLSCTVKPRLDRSEDAICFPATFQERLMIYSVQMGSSPSMASFESLSCAVQDLICIPSQTF